MNRPEANFQSDRWKCGSYKGSVMLKYLRMLLSMGVVMLYLWDVKSEKQDSYAKYFSSFEGWSGFAGTLA